MNKLNPEYSQWRNKQFSDKIGFFPIFSDFKPFLRELSPGAISLYVYLGLHSNYNTGESFHSIKKIAIFFDKSPRTISNWIHELEKFNLITRKQIRLNAVSHTFLTPYNWEPGYLKKTIIEDDIADLERLEKKFESLGYEDWPL